MGKSEVVPMPIHRQDNLYNVYGAYNKMVHTVEEEIEDQQEDYPENMQLFANQVAGHTNDGTSYGMIKHNGTILKPITKKCGEKEVQFYEEINSASDETRSKLREFVPKFYGKVTIPIKGNSVDCIVLEDLTKHYHEPCIMDIKIGRKTWDPNATYEKITNEDMKYQECKRDLAFCIPGFQVYKIYNKQLCKFDKNYGKTLNKETVPQALKTFLNADSTCCRSLIVQFLASLWRIQMWARQQRYYHFYSSSLLLVYDARRLRESLKFDAKPTFKLNRSTSLYRPLSLAVLNNNENEKIPTGFSGQLTNQGPILKVPASPNKLKQFNDFVQSNNKSNNVWQKSIKTLKRTHSFQNDYDKDMQSKKQDYTSMLDDLCYEQTSEMWASVKMIDFAHVFPAEHHDIDRNYLDGIDNLIRIFEEFLVESE